MSKPNTSKINLEISEYPGMNASRTLFGRLVGFIDGIMLPQVEESDEQRFMEGVSTGKHLLGLGVFWMR